MAWRPAATGYVFGVAATEGAPTEWFYEGDEPPTGWPDDDERWTRYSGGSNWW